MGNNKERMQEIVGTRKIPPTNPTHLLEPDTTHPIPNTSSPNQTISNTNHLLNENIPPHPIIPKPHSPHNPRKPLIPYRPPYPYHPSKVKPHHLENTLAISDQLISLELLRNMMNNPTPTHTHSLPI